MSIVIDGYVAPAKETAYEQGVQFTYPTKYGDIVIRSKLADRSNTQFRLAMQNHTQWSQRRKNLSKGQIDHEAENRFIGLVYDTLVISWSTTIKSGGNVIEPSRQNFIDVLKSPATKGVLELFLEDSSDEDFFRAETTEESAGKSVTPSGGSSTGAERPNGSAR